jgi:hypothetical protein
LFKRFDLYRENRICPICDGKMIKYDHSHECTNGCYEIHFGYGNEEFIIFGENITTVWDEDMGFTFFAKLKIKKKIKYWKQDERYLAEILMR